MKVGIALNMLSALGSDDVVSKSKLPMSAMGGIATWKDAAEFLLLGAAIGLRKVRGNNERDARCTFRFRGIVGSHRRLLPA